MESLPKGHLKQLKNDFDLIEGINNSICTNQLIVTTYICIGHGPAETTGLVMNDTQMMKLALSFSICDEVCASLNRMLDNEASLAKVYK